jgi:hypothetical protein
VFALLLFSGCTEIVIKGSAGNIDAESSILSFGGFHIAPTAAPSITVTAKGKTVVTPPEGQNRQD